MFPKDPLEGRALWCSEINNCSTSPASWLLPGVITRMAETAILESLWLSPLGQSPHKTRQSQSNKTKQGKTLEGPCIPPGKRKPGLWLWGAQLLPNAGLPRRGHSMPKGSRHSQGSDIQGTPASFTAWKTKAGGQGLPPPSTPLTCLRLLFTAVLPP